MSNGNNDTINSQNLVDAFVEFIKDRKYSFRSVLGSDSLPDASELKQSPNSKWPGFLLTVGSSKYKVMLDVEEFVPEE